jgi:2-oxoglutarate dehydrogenase E1 component
MRHVIDKIWPQLYLTVSSRPASAAPASGYMSQHAEEQETLVNEAING